MGNAQNGSSEKPPQPSCGQPQQPIVPTAGDGNVAPPRNYDQEYINGWDPATDHSPSDGKYIRNGKTLYTPEQEAMAARMKGLDCRAGQTPYEPVKVSEMAPEQEQETIDYKGHVSYDQNHHGPPHNSQFSVPHEHQSHLEHLQYMQQQQQQQQMLNHQHRGEQHRSNESQHHQHQQEPKSPEQHRMEQQQLAMQARYNQLSVVPIGSGPNSQHSTDANKRFESYTQHVIFPPNMQPAPQYGQQPVYQQNTHQYSPYGHNAPYGQHTQQAAYGQSPYGPYGQHSAYGQQPPYGQNGQYGQNAPSGQHAPYGQHESYGQNGQHAHQYYQPSNPHAHQGSRISPARLVHGHAL